MWMGESDMLGDDYTDKEKSRYIQFHSDDLQSATIYFDEVDGRKFSK